jgi:hypothetical protein
MQTLSPSDRTAAGRQNARGRGAVGGDVLLASPLAIGGALHLRYRR